MTPPRPLAASRLRRLAAIFFVLGSVVFVLILLDRLGLFIASFSGLLLIVFLAWLLAFVMSPLVAALHERLSLPRPLAVGLSFLLVSLSVAGLIFASASIGLSEATELIRREPEASARLMDTLAGIQNGLHLNRNFLDLVALYQQAHATLVPELAATLGGQMRIIAETTIGILGSLFMLVVLSVYMVVDSQGILGTLNRAIPSRYSDELQLVERSVARAFSGFLRIQLSLVIIQVVLTLAIGVLFGLPFLFLIAIVSALAMFIPFFGPPLALLPPLAVAAIFAPGAFLPVLLLMFVSQTVLVNVIQPRLMRQRVGMHPILVLLALMAGAQVAGLWGAIFGIPVAAVVIILISYLINLRVVAEAQDVPFHAAADEVAAIVPDLPLEEAAALAAAHLEEVEEARGA